MQTFDVWDPDYNLDLYLSTKNLNISWFPNGSKIFNNIEPVKNSHNKKIALLNWTHNKVSDRISCHDLSWADLIICNDTEVARDSLNDFYEYATKFFNNQNIIFIMGGHLTDQIVDHDKMLSPNLFFLHRISHTLHINEITDYDFIKPRPFIFDALLGGKKDNRIEVFKSLERLNLLEKSLVNLEDNIYFQIKSIPDYRSPILDQLEHQSFLNFRKAAQGDINKLYATANIGVYYKNSNRCMWASHLISADIYKNSWYSIVAETDHRYFFFTEKTAKCLLAKRIFLYMAAPYQLKLLREYGFKTFDGIIDESYDNEPKFYKRAKMIEEQIKFLSSSDPVKLYEQAMPILDHNFNLIKDMSWQINNVKNFIQTHLNRLK